MKSIKILLLILIIIIVIIFNVINVNNVKNNKYKENFEINSYFYEKEYKKTPIPTSVKTYDDNCLEICNDNTFCEVFNKKKENYNKCIKCDKKGYCFKKFGTNQTLCEPCIKGVNYIHNCNSIFIDACPRQDDIYNFNGIKPYFKVIEDNSVYNPYNTKCLSCNNNI